MVVKLSDRVKVEWFRQILPTAPEEQDDEIAVSNVGIIAAARVIPLVSGKPFIAVSMYARWFRLHPLSTTVAEQRRNQGSQGLER